jgi:hypothetical protein
MPRYIPEPIRSSTIRRSIIGVNAVGTIGCLGILLWTIGSVIARQDPELPIVFSLAPSILVAFGMFASHFNQQHFEHYSEKWAFFPVKFVAWASAVCFTANCVLSFKLDAPGFLSYLVLAILFDSMTAIAVVSERNARIPA